MTLPPETLAAFDDDAFRSRVFIEKYALRGAEGEFAETVPSEMWRRVAREIARAEPVEQQEQREREFLWLLTDFRMVPGGRILHALGNPNKVTALNCYVLPSPEDSISGIYHTAWELAETFKRGGGCGVDISSLRPKNAPVRNAARTSTGAVSFMELYSLTTGLIGQSGRRGALMITLADSHPDLPDFCRIKQNLDRVRYANISVRITDRFMEAVQQDLDWELHFESAEEGGPAIRKTVRARAVWRELIEGARNFAEPGCIFWDTVRRFSLSDQYPGMEVVSTNPCGEEPLEPYGDCCLASLNLSAFVNEPFTSEAAMDLESLERAARSGVRFLDNVLTLNEERHALPQQREAARRTRRIGLGVMGLADMLCGLRLPYGTDEAIQQAERLVERIKLWAYDESANLSRERGAFPAFDPARHFSSPFFASFPRELLEKLSHTGLRHMTLLTIPPTGSTAALAGCTSGIEPIFDVTYTRRSESLSETSFAVVHPLVQAYRKTHDPAGDAPLPSFFQIAHDIDPSKRVLMQAALQRHIDQAISSTINLPATVEFESVAELYALAWESGCKGITIYREGAREGVLLSAKAQETTGPGFVAPRPPMLPGVTLRQETPLGTAFVTINHTREKTAEPFEVFVRLGKAGSDLEADAEALGRLISLVLRLPSPMNRLDRLQEIRDQLKHIGGARSIHYGPSRVRSLADGIARVLGTYLELAAVEQGAERPADDQRDFCPRCRHAALIVSQGCLRCTECGFKEC